MLTTDVPPSLTFQMDFAVKKLLTLAVLAPLTFEMDLRVRKC